MFVPNRILFEKNSLDYEIGNNIFNTFKDNPKVEIINMASNKIKSHIPGDNIYDFYRNGKKHLSCKYQTSRQVPIL